jgi:hypothetical protein
VRLPVPPHPHESRRSGSSFTPRAGAGAERSRAGAPDGVPPARPPLPGVASPRPASPAERQPEPDAGASRLLSLWVKGGRGRELRPRAGGSSAGGIRTHGLELMRLARTASPLPRRSARLDSNQESGTRARTSPSTFQSVASCRLDDPGMSFDVCMTRSVQNRTMLFKPLACPSALDRGLE